MTEQQSRPDVAALWLKAQQEIADQVAHELRNSLNGVAVNVEVVRSRLARKGCDVATVAPFAETAASAMEALSGVAEAFLTLARPPRQPADAGTMLQSLFTLLEPVARRTDDEVRFRAPATGDGVTAAPGEITRLTLAAVTLEALKAPATVDCKVEPVEDSRFSVRFSGWFPIHLPDAIVVVAQSADIRFDQGGGDGVRLTLPLFRG